MYIAVVLGCLVGVAMLEGGNCQPEEHLSDQVAVSALEAVNGNEEDEISSPDVNQENPRKGQHMSLCRRKLSGMCVRRKKQCPGRYSSSTSKSKPYCSKFHRCCYNVVN